MKSFNEFILEKENKQTEIKQLKVGDKFIINRPEGKTEYTLTQKDYDLIQKDKPFIIQTDYGEEKIFGNTNIKLC